MVVNFKGMGPKGDVASRRDANEGCWTSLDEGQQVLLSMTDSSKTPHDNAFTESAVNSSSMCAVGGDNTNSVQSYDSIFKGELIHIPCMANMLRH